MAHSNKPQPDVNDGPYFQDCEAYAEMSEEQRYHEEMLYEEGAKQDRYDGWDRGDLEHPENWERDDVEAPEAETVSPPPAPPAARVLSDDDILF